MTIQGSYYTVITTQGKGAHTNEQLFSDQEFAGAVSTTSGTGRKAPATIQKYKHDLTVLSRWAGATALTKERLVAYKAELEQQYRPASVNAVISSLNGFFKWCGWHDLTLKAVKIQREVFRSSDRELTKEEYQRLLDAARTNHDVRLWLIIETICATGIRVSEVQFITIQASRNGRAEIRCKGKNRICA